MEQIQDKLKSKEYDFLRTDKNLGNNIIILTLGGSHAYGMDKEGSDLDVRGIALNSKSDILLGTDFEQKDIFKPTNTGRVFISIDMRKANFSSLHEYDRNIFRGTDTWEDFISQFTDNEHIINSKYIRQVILGNCNPKRHITYEKYLMDQTLSLLYDIIGEERIVFFSNDEIVYDMTTANNLHMLNLVRNCVEERLSTKSNIPFRVELFSLHKINGTDGYCKKIYKENGEYNIEFKCLDNYMMPFVLRYFLGEEITESDKVFYHEGLLAKFIDEPKIEVNLKEVI